MFTKKGFASVLFSMNTFEMILCINAATPLPYEAFITINETYSMSYCIIFFLRGHKNHQTSNLKISLKSTFIIKVDLVVLVPLEGKFHTVPCLNYSQYF